MKRPILILQHQIPERPAYLTTWLEQHGIAYETRNAGAGDEFPDTIEPYEAMAIMGGGMSANDVLPSNRRAEVLVQQAVFKKHRPVIGHCLGGQLMSRALGAEIRPSPQPEIGWQPIEYLEHPLVDHWFGATPTPQVMQWHYESFDIPPGATPLAASRACPNQAWCLGPHLAMQFHIEMDDAKVRAWAEDEDPGWSAARARHDTVQDGRAILEGIEPHLLHHQATADHIYRRWLEPTVWADKYRFGK